MIYGKKLIKFVQRQLSKMLGYSMAIDGEVGPTTLGMLAQIPDIPVVWSKKRQIIGFVQYLCKINNIEIGAIDGYNGPMTDSGYDDLLYLLEHGELPNLWRVEEGVGASQASSRWPIQTQQELFNFYGDVGQHQVLLETPYPMRLAWKPSQKIKRFSCHEKVADAMDAALNDIKHVYGMQRIKDLRLDLWGGCLNVRKVRGGNYYSTHSWGISMDFDPANNKLRWGADRATFARPEYDDWWNIWESQGAMSLGRAKNYDYMHLQFARIR